MDSRIKDKKGVAQIKIDHVLFEISEIIGTTKSDVWVMQQNKNDNPWRHFHIGYLSIQPSNSEISHTNKQLVSDIWELYKQHIKLT